MSEWCQRRGWAQDWERCLAQGLFEDFLVASSSGNVAVGSVGLPVPWEQPPWEAARETSSFHLKAGLPDSDHSCLRCPKKGGTGRVWGWGSCAMAEGTAERERQSSQRRPCRICCQPGKQSKVDGVRLNLKARTCPARTVRFVTSPFHHSPLPFCLFSGLINSWD